MNGKLIVTEEGRDRVHEIIEDITRVGRGPEVDLHLRDESSSRVHCEIRREAHGFKLLDLETPDGTQVNGRTINHHYLQNGDTIRIGSAQLTFLGDSASHTPKPRKREPLVGLTELPRDDEGHPRRFYRHEFQKSGIGSGVTILLILLGLGLVALLIVWSSNTEYGVTGESEMAAARSLRQQGDVKSLEKALVVLQGIPQGGVDARDLRTLEDEIRSALHAKKAAEIEAKSAGEFNAIKSYFAANPDRMDHLKSRIISFKGVYPESPYVRDLEALLHKAALGGPEQEKLWEDLLASLRLSLKGRDFKGAFAALAKAESDPQIGQIFAQRIETHRETLEREFRRHYETMSEMALNAKTSGDTATARRIYTDLAAVGCDPLSSEAKQLLELLK